MSNCFFFSPDWGNFTFQHYFIFDNSWYWKKGNTHPSHNYLSKLDTIEISAWWPPSSPWTNKSKLKLSTFMMTSCKQWSLISMIWENKLGKKEWKIFMRDRQGERVKSKGKNFLTGSGSKKQNKAKKITISIKSSKCWRNKTLIINFDFISS